MSKFIYRAGWPKKGNRRVGFGWAWIGPYVVGLVGRWDHEPSDLHERLRRRLATTFNVPLAVLGDEGAPSPDEDTARARDENAGIRPERQFFGLWRNLDLINPEGQTFLRRRGFDGSVLRMGGLLIHFIDRPDPGLDLHDHPWAFWTLILRGGYTEEYAATRDAQRLSAEAEALDVEANLDDYNVVSFVQYADPKRAHLRDKRQAPRGEIRTWERGSIHRMTLNDAHRIIHAQPGTVTILLRTSKKRRWGFFLPTGWIDWEDYDYGARRPGGVRSNRPGENMEITSSGMGA